MASIWKGDIYEDASWKPIPGERSQEPGNNWGPEHIRAECGCLVLDTFNIFLCLYIHALAWFRCQTCRQQELSPRWWLSAGLSCQTCRQQDGAVKYSSFKDWDGKHAVSRIKVSVMLPSWPKYQLCIPYIRNWGFQHVITGFKNRRCHLQGLRYQICHHQDWMSNISSTGLKHAASRTEMSNTPVSRI